MAEKTSTTRYPTIRLKPGERILISGRALRRILPASSIAQGLLMGLAAGTFVGLMSISHDHLAVWAPVAGLTAAGLFGGVFWALALMRWSWHRWWLTDKRLVVRRGFIGYQLQSVPLDRIVDVTLQASWWDRIWGLRHIQVRDMNSEVTASMHHSRGLRLLAVPDAEDVSEMVLSACPGVTTNGSELGEVVSLLRELVAKAS